MDYDTLSDVVVENQVYIYDFFFKYVDIYHWTDVVRAWTRFHYPHS
jgi:hypothetical protein